MDNIISISDKAANQIKKIISIAEFETDGIIVGVDKSGCSGYAVSYTHLTLPTILLV